MKRTLILLLCLSFVVIFTFCQRETTPTGPGGRANPVPWDVWKDYSAGGGFYAYQGFIKNEGTRRADSVRVVLSWPTYSIVDSAYVEGMTFITARNETSRASLDPDQIGSFEVVSRGSGSGWRVDIRWAELDGTIVP